MKELEVGSYYLCIINAKEYIFKWDGTEWNDSLFGIVPRSLLEHMHVAGRMISAQSLADIRAEAVGRFAECIRYEYEGPMNTDSLEDFADEYANRIKEG